MKPHRDDIKLINDEFIIEQKSTIYYGILSPENLYIKRGCTIHGDIICEKKVYIENDNIIHGDVLSKGSSTVCSGTRIEGCLVSGVSIKIFDNVFVEREILADGDISIGSVTAKRIEAMGDITITGEIKTKNIKAGGRIVSK